MLIVANKPLVGLNAQVIFESKEKTLFAGAFIRLKSSFTGDVNFR